MLGAWFAAMREEIEAEGGTVEKFIGDAVMAVFGVPRRTRTTPRARSVRRSGCATPRGAQRASSRPQRRSARGPGRDQHRRGVAVAEPRPGEPLVTGDAVNAAARLEQRPSRATSSWRAHGPAAPRASGFAPLGDRELRGQGRPGASRSSSSRGAGSWQRGVPRPAGADRRPRPRARAAADRSSSGSAAERRPHLVTVYGEPGVGKSRLVARVPRRAETGRPRRASSAGAASPYGDGVAYWPLAEILKGSAGRQRQRPADVALDQIRAPAPSSLTPDSTPDPPRVGARSPTRSGSRTRQSASRRWTRARCARRCTPRGGRSSPRSRPTRTVVAVVEDIHWADAALLDLLEELADRVVGPRAVRLPGAPELTAAAPDLGRRPAQLLERRPRAARPRRRRPPRRAAPRRRRPPGGRSATRILDARRRQPVLPRGDRPPPDRRAAC